MLSPRIASCLVAFAYVLAAALPASSLTQPQQKAPPHPTKVLIKMGKCDKQVTYNLPAQRFDETAQAIARATGCYIRYPDKSLVNVPVQPVRGRLTRRQALRVALRGTPLRIVRETPNLMEVVRVSAR